MQFEDNHLESALGELEFDKFNSTFIIRVIVLQENLKGLAYITYLSNGALNLSRNVAGTVHQMLGNHDIEKCNNGQWNRVED